MAQINRTSLKPKFEAAKRPTESDFFSLIDSAVNIIDDKATVAEAQNETINDKFITPQTVKSSVLHFTPVKTVNGATPVNDNVTIPDASETISGTVKKASENEANTGTNDTKYISPLLARKIIDSYIKLNGASPVNGNFTFTSFDNSGWIALPNTNFNAANSITNINAATAIKYRKKNGVIFLDGCFKGGAAQANGTTYELFTLPAGFTPPRKMSFVISRADTSISTFKSGRIDIDVNGKVYGVSSSDLWNSISGISFPAD